MRRGLEVTIVGPGRVGSALAKALHDAGVAVAEIVYRSAESGKAARRLGKAVEARAVEFEGWLKSRSVAPPGRARAPGPTLKPVPTMAPGPRLIWLCVGDSAIAETAARMAKGGSWKGCTVFHSSGALTSDELGLLRRAGAEVASVHPMMTFVRSSLPPMHGVPFALEGDQGAVAVARRLVRTLGGESFAINKKDKPLYHALGAFVSPLVIAQMSTVERIGRELGFTPRQTRRIAAPILRQTVLNYIAHGPAAAFSGPIVRGDAATVKKNLAALRRVRGAAEIYRALARVGVEELPSKDAKSIVRALKRQWGFLGPEGLSE